jgi:hypothetical protein
MNAYTILNSRKRTIIALVHTFAFGLLAFWQFATNQHPTDLMVAARPHLAGPIALTVIYFIVTTGVVDIVQAFEACTGAFLFRARLG